MEVFFILDISPTNSEQKIEKLNSGTTGSWPITLSSKNTTSAELLRLIH